MRRDKGYWPGLRGKETIRWPVAWLTERRATSARGTQAGRGQPRGVDHHCHRPAHRNRSRCERRTAGRRYGAAAGRGGNGDNGLPWAGCRDGHLRPVRGDAHPAADLGAARCAAAGLGRHGRHAASDRGGDRRSRDRYPDRAPRSRRDANMRAAALPRTVPRMREQCWRHPGSTSRSISSRPRSATPSRDGRKQHLTLTCTRPRLPSAAAKARGVPVSVASIFPVWEMRICEPLGGRWR